MSWVEYLRVPCQGNMQGRPARRWIGRVFCNSVGALTRCSRCALSTCAIHGRWLDGEFWRWGCRPEIVIDLTGPGEVEIL